MAALLKKPYCTADINYTTNGQEFDSVATTIFDGRQAGNLSMAKNGFELLGHKSEVQDWGNLEEIERLHYDEILQLAKELTGCKTVLFYPALIRQRAPGHDAPIEFAHSDYTEKYSEVITDAQGSYAGFLAASMTRAGLSFDDIRAAQRVVTIQMWRNTGPVNADSPLALCDTSGVARSDLLELSTPAGYEGGDFCYFGLACPEHSEKYDWYTFPNLTADELILFRAYDSELVKEHEPFWAPHSAFNDPNGSEPRRSVEMRAICLF